MHTSNQHRVVRRTGALIVGLILLAWASPARAGGGEVQPPTAKPHGYSLSDAAAATAAFNSGPRTLDTLPKTPFQVLYVKPGDVAKTFVVKSGTSFYVPVESVDDSPPILGDFPQDVSDQDDDADYFFNPDELGGSDFTIEVDGKATELDADYVAGVTTAPLPDGGGRHYIVIGAFLTPMSKGTHIVKISGTLDGAAIGGSFSFEITYTVIVQN